MCLLPLLAVPCLDKILALSVEKREIQSKPVYSNYFFAAENGKNKPIVRKNR